MGEKWKPGKMHTEYCVGVGGQLSEEEQREKGLYSVNRVSIFNDPDEYMPKFPFKDFDWAKLTEKAIAPLEELKDDMTTPPIIPVKGSDPQDLPQFKPKCNPESIRQGIEPPPPQRRRRPITTSQQREKALKRKRELYAAQGKCLTEAPLSPFCQCSKLGGATSSYDMPLPDGAYEEHRHNIVPIWLAYLRQTRQSHCFDVDHHPGSCIFGASIAPLPPSMDFNNKAKLPMELAHRAIHEYNDKKCNVFKYQVLKIEKVNLAKQGNSFQYWMTVKVLNLTLATPIETFQVHGGVRILKDDDKVIYCFRPKEEEIVGLPSCDVCFGKLRGEEEPLGLGLGFYHLTFEFDLTSLLIVYLVYYQSYVARILRKCCRLYVGFSKSNAFLEDLAWVRRHFGLSEQHRLSPGLQFSKFEEDDFRKGELPEKFLVHLNRWNDDDFIPKAASKEHREEFHRIYGRYFRQIFQSDGFDLDIYPGDAKEAVYIPYLDFEKEADMLWELANHAIQDYNNRETSVYKYKVSYIEKVNFSVAECREFYMTVKVINLTLRTPLETFQIHAFKGPHGENVVRLCRKKMRI